MTSDEFGNIEQLDENLRKWFKEKWVRFGPDGKIRGACARGDDSEGKPKCLPQKKAHSLGKKGRKYAASKKRREDPNPERRGKAKNVATKKKSNEDIQVNEKWSQKYKDSINCSNPKGFSQKAHCAGKKKNEDMHDESKKCPHCGGPLYPETMINEKKDACYHKVRSRYKVWPSAYASGALVQCRKKGASNWGNKSKKNESSIMKGLVDETAYEAELQDNEPRIVSGVYGAKSKEFRKKFANQQAQDRFFDHPDREGNFEIHYVQKANMAEGVIIGHDKDDPEVAVLGGAGSYKLSNLKKKAQMEANELAKDVASGKFKNSAYNVKQLANTLNTIVAAEDEMEKLYFGEDFTGQFAAERTAETNPYGGMKDRQYRGALGEDIDEAREMSPALKAAQKNLAGLASGEVQRRERERKAAEKAQRQASKDLDRMLNRKPAKKSKQDLETLWAKIESVIANSFPDGDPYDSLWPYLQKHGFTQDDVERASKMNGYDDLWDYWNTLTQDIENDAYYDWHATGGKNVRTRGTFVETPTDNPTGASGEGGWRRTDLDEYREMSPELRAAQKNLIALRNKEKSVNVSGKRERVSKEPSTDDKPKPASVLAKGAQEVDPATQDAIAAFLAKGGEIKKGRPGKAPPTGRQQASKHIGGGGKYRKRSDTPGQGANYRGAAIVAVEEEQLDEKCWDGYKQIGMKKKGDRMVPNCVQKESAIMRGLKRESK